LTFQTRLMKTFNPILTRPSELRGG